MPNSITLAQKYVDVLDQVYKVASLSSVLDGQNELARQGANAHELIIPKLDMDGLANYNRNTGFVDGAVAQTWETKVCNYDRGRKFMVDRMDNQESANIAFGRLAGEFIRTKAAPEIDAFRFAEYAGTDGIGEATGTLATGANVVEALRAGTNYMEEAEVDMNGLILFITPTLYNKVADLDTTKSRAAIDQFAKVVKVPQSRFYTAVDLNDGVSGSQEHGGYKKAALGQNINFLIVDPAAIIQYNKHVQPRTFSPDVNQKMDAWQYDFRCLGIAEVFDNKKAGVYCNSVAGK